MTKRSQQFTKWLPNRLERIDLVQSVADQLRQRILDDTFPTGSFLPGEMKLGARFGVSRSVVREALRVLSAQGLIQLSHGRLPRVTTPDPQASIVTLGALFKRLSVTPLDLIDVRQVLEAEIAALAATRAKPADLQALNEACRALKSAKNAEDAALADVSFHLRLAEATGNSGFVCLIQTMRAVFFESVRETQERCGPDVHDAILAAIEARDASGARAAMLDHIHKTKRLLSRAGDTAPESAIPAPSEPNVPLTTQTA